MFELYYDSLMTVMDFGFEQDLSFKTLT